MDDKSAYKKKMEAKIDEINAEIQRLRAKAKGAEADAELKARDWIASLESKRDHLSGKLAELRQSTGESWKDIREGLDHAYAEMEQALTKAFARYK